MAELLLKRIQPSASKMSSLLFRSRSFCILLGFILMGHFVAGYKTGADSDCLSCSAITNYTQSFTIRNALPQANSNLFMVCSIWSDCGEFFTYSSDFPCHSVEFDIDAQSSCSCPHAVGAEQVVCEFKWTKPNDEWFVRAQVLVWSGDSAAPKKTYYMVDDSGFWFSSSPDGTLTKTGAWVGGNYLSSETSIMGRVGQVKGFGRNHCRVSS